jgi:hypothetical protein
MNSRARYELTLPPFVLPFVRLARWLRLRDCSDWYLFQARRQASSMGSPLR